MDYKRYIAQKLCIEGASAEETAELIATPPDPAMGDYALPCFKFAKLLKKSPAAIAADLAARFQRDDVVTDVSAVNGYLNFRVDRKSFADAALMQILAQGEA